MSGLLDTIDDISVEWVEKIRHQHQNPLVKGSAAAQRRIFLQLPDGLEYFLPGGKEGTQAPVAAKYFDDMMSVYFSPKMMTNVIGYMEDYLNGNWNYEVGAGKYEVVWIVDKNNVSEYEGFTGHA